MLEKIIANSNAVNDISNKKCVKCVNRKMFLKDQGERVSVRNKSDAGGRDKNSMVGGIWREEINREEKYGGRRKRGQMKRNGGFKRDGEEEKKGKRVGGGSTKNGKERKGRRNEL